MVVRRVSHVKIVNQLERPVRLDVVDVAYVRQGGGDKGTQHVVGIDWFVYDLLVEMEL